MVERETVARIKRQQDRVIDRRGLNFEIEALAKALANREAERPIEADTERCVNHDLSTAEPIEEPLDYERALVGNRPERRQTASHVGD